MQIGGYVVVYMKIFFLNRLLSRMHTDISYILQYTVFFLSFSYG